MTRPSPVTPPSPDTCSVNEEDDGGPTGSPWSARHGKAPSAAPASDQPGQSSSSAAISTDSLLSLPTDDPRGARIPAPCPKHGPCSPFSLSERRPRERCPHG